MYKGAATRNTEAQGECGHQDEQGGGEGPVTPQGAPGFGVGVWQGRLGSGVQVNQATHDSARSANAFLSRSRTSASTPRTRPGGSITNRT